MNDNSKYHVVRIPMKKAEHARFLKLFRHSRFRAQSEFMRFLINQYAAVVKK